MVQTNGVSCLRAQNREGCFQLCRFVNIFCHWTGTLVRDNISLVCWRRHMCSFDSSDRCLGKIPPSHTVNLTCKNYTFYLHIFHNNNHIPNVTHWKQQFTTLVHEWRCTVALACSRFIPTDFHCVTDNKYGVGLHFIRRRQVVLVRCARVELQNGAIFCNFETETWSLFEFHWQL